MLINGDVWSDYPLAELGDSTLSDNLDAWLLLVNNPEHNRRGDFALRDNIVHYAEQQTATFSGISLIRPSLFADHRDSDDKAFPLRDALRPAILAGRVGGAVYTGRWCDVGTVARYQQLESIFKQENNSS